MQNSASLCYNQQFIIIIVKLLVDLNVNINAQHNQSQISLHDAQYYRYHECLIILLYHKESKVNI